MARTVRMKIEHEWGTCDVLEDPKGSHRLVEHVYVRVGRKVRTMTLDDAYRQMVDARRAAMRAGAADKVAAGWIVARVAEIGGSPVKHPRIFFCDHDAGTRLTQASAHGGMRVIIPRAEVPSPKTARAANRDPDHPLWDAMAAILDTDESETS